MSEGLPKTQGEDVDANNNAGGSEWDILSDMPDFSEFNDDNIEWDFDGIQNEKEPSHSGLYDLVEAPAAMKAMEEPHVERTSEESEQKPGGVVSWDEIKDVFSDERYELLGHGTRSREDADSILASGLRVGNQSGYDARDTDIDSNFYRLKRNPDEMHDILNNWEHEEVKHIVLFRIPVKYKTPSSNSYAASSYVAFYTGDGTKGTYDKEYAFGWYDAERDEVHLNPDYHGDLDNKKDVAYLEREKERIEKYLD